MKCDSCGAPIENGKCSYCGKVFEEKKSILLMFNLQIRHGHFLIQVQRKK